MNTELGFGRRVLACIEKYGIPFEHMPSSIDTLCVVLEDAKVKDNINDIVDDIHRTCEPDSVEIVRNLALIATVGKRMRESIGTAATLFSAMAKANINVRMIDQGSSEMNIIVGVKKPFGCSIFAFRYITATGVIPAAYGFRHTPVCRAGRTC